MQAWEWAQAVGRRAAVGSTLHMFDAPIHDAVYGAGATSPTYTVFAGATILVCIWKQVNDVLFASHVFALGLIAFLCGAYVILCVGQYARRALHLDTFASRVLKAAAAFVLSAVALNLYTLMVCPLINVLHVASCLVWIGLIGRHLYDKYRPEDSYLDKPPEHFWEKDHSE